MKVVVIGGAGYIGSVVATQLTELGHQVSVVDRLIYGAGRSMTHLDGIGVPLIRADIRQAEPLRDAMAGAAAIVHLGGFVGEPASDLNPELTIETNFCAPVLAAQLAAAAGIPRFVFASTGSVYGVQDDEVDESSRPNPISLYARTKLHAEQAVLDRLTDAHVFALRLSTVFGLSPRMRLDSVVNKMTARAVTGLPLQVFGGVQWRPFVHVADVADLIARLIKGDGDGLLDGVINVGSDRLNLTISDVARTIARVCPGTDVQIGPAEDGRSYRVGFRKLASVMPDACSTTLDDGIAAMRLRLLDNEFGDIASTEYDNHAGLKAALAAGDILPIGDPDMAALTTEYRRRCAP